MYTPPHAFSTFHQILGENRYFLILPIHLLLFRYLSDYLTIMNKTFSSKRAYAKPSCKLVAKIPTEGCFMRSKNTASPKSDEKTEKKNLNNNVK